MGEELEEVGQYDGGGGQGAPVGGERHPGNCLSVASEGLAEAAGLVSVGAIRRNDSLLGGNAELKTTTEVDVGDAVGRSHHAVGDGGVLSRKGLVSMARSDRGGYYRRDQQYC